MKICVCGGTNPATNPEWLGIAERFGELLCECNYEMIWGGNAHGVLSRVHKKYNENEKPNTLVLPVAYESDLEHMTVKDVVKTNLVTERTHKMFTMADVVVCLPGGIGTIYEFWNAVEGKRAGEYNIDVLLLNYKGFYKHQLAHFDFINKHGFTKIGKGGAPYKMKAETLFTTVETPEQLVKELAKIKKKRSL